MQRSIINIRGQWRRKANHAVFLLLIANEVLDRSDDALVLNSFYMLSSSNRPAVMDRHRTLPSSSHPLAFAQEDRLLDLDGYSSPFLDVRLQLLRLVDTSDLCPMLLQW